MKSFWDRFRLAQVDQGTSSGATPVVKQNQQTRKRSPFSSRKSSSPLKGAPSPCRTYRLSIAAFSQTDITRLAISGIDDLMRLTPGLAARNNAAYSPVISIRGIAGGSGNSTAGIYIDDTPTQVRMIGAGITSTSAFSTVFDLERIEVLRGTAGHIVRCRFRGGARCDSSRRNLRFTDYTGHARAEFWIQRSGGAKLPVSVPRSEGPLLPDRLAFRVAAYVQEDGGWIGGCC